MTVKELREKLEAMPKNNKVLLFCANEAIDDAEIEVVFRQGETVYLEYRNL